MASLGGCENVRRLDVVLRFEGIHSLTFRGLKVMGAFDLTVSWHMRHYFIRRNYSYVFQTFDWVGGVGVGDD